MKDDIKRPDVFRDAKDSLDKLLSTLNSIKIRLEQEQKIADRKMLILGFIAAFLIGFLAS